MQQLQTQDDVAEAITLALALRHSREPPRACACLGKLNPDDPLCACRMRRVASDVQFVLDKVWSEIEYLRTLTGPVSRGNFDDLVAALERKRDLPEVS